MNNILVNLSTDKQEVIDNNLLSKLAVLLLSNANVDLTGNIYASLASMNTIYTLCLELGLIEDLNSPGTYRGDNFILVVGATSIDFEDPEVERVLIANGIGSLAGITSSDITNVLLNKIFRGNTVITRFNEFKYFNTANSSPSYTSNEMFMGCSNLALIDLTNCRILKDDAFRGTKLTTVNAPSLTSLGIRCFYLCKSLLSVLDLGNVPSLGASNFFLCSALISVVLPSSCTSIGWNCFSETSNLSTINLNNITTVGEYGFRNSLLSNVDASTDLLNITTLGLSAFSSTSMLGSTLRLPKLLLCGNNAFSSATGNISKIESIGKLPSIPLGMFSSYGASTTLIEVDLPYECTSIGQAAFNWQQELTTVKLYNKSIDEFEEGETKTFFPNLSKITNFGLECFRGCLKLNISVLDILNATNIGQSSFYNCKLLSGTINLPNLNSLGNGAFESTSITSVTGLGNVLNIGDITFKNCTSLASVNLPSGTTFGSSCFYNDTALTSISPFPSSYPYGIFYNCNNLLGSISSTSISISGHLNFSFCSNLTFPNELTLSSPTGCVGYRAFLGCKVKKVILDSTITSIYNASFEGCTDLEEIVGLNHITKLGSACFKGTKISGHIDLSALLDNVPSDRIDNAVLGDYGDVFMNCLYITSIKFGNLPILCYNHHAHGFGGMFYGCLNLHTVDCDSIGQIKTFGPISGVYRADFGVAGAWSNSNMRNFIIRSNNPPTIVGDISNLHINYFGGPTVTIYVQNVLTYIDAGWPSTVTLYMDYINNYTPITS